LPLVTPKARLAPLPTRRYLLALRIPHSSLSHVYLLRSRLPSCARHRAVALRAFTRHITTSSHACAHNGFATCTAIHRFAAQTHSHSTVLRFACMVLLRNLATFTTTVRNRFFPIRFFSPRMEERRLPAHHTHGFTYTAVLPPRYLIRDNWITHCTPARDASPYTRHLAPLTPPLHHYRWRSAAGRTPHNVAATLSLRFKRRLCAPPFTAAARNAAAAALVLPTYLPLHARCIRACHRAVRLCLAYLYFFSAAFPSPARLPSTFTDDTRAL